jgi:hypothetical protein
MVMVVVPVVVVAEVVVERGNISVMRDGSTYRDPTCNVLQKVAWSDPATTIDADDDLRMRIPRILRLAVVNRLPFCLGGIGIALQSLRALVTGAACLLILPDDLLLSHVQVLASSPVVVHATSCKKHRRPSRPH